MKNSSQESLNSESSRIAALDNLRAFAIIWVILLHCEQGCLPKDSNSTVQNFVRAGGFGVDLFFVLSGFLISSILIKGHLKSGKIQIAKFWYRRWMRTLPAYYVTLFVVMLGDAFYESKVPWSNRWSYFLFLQTSVNDFGDVRFAWSWSLCVEELFYFALPITTSLSLLFTFNIKLAIRCISLAAIGISFVGRALSESSGGHLPGYAVPYCRLDGLACGMVISTLPKFQNKFWSFAMILTALVILGASVWAVTPTGFKIHQYFPVSIAFSLILYSVMLNDSWRNIRIPGAYSVAAISYSLYLIHPIVIVLLLKLTPNVDWMFRLLFLVILLALLATALRCFVELPFLFYRDKKSIGEIGHKAIVSDQIPVKL
ncbi:acyltransferase [Telmatocola sphagniphila]|uniref:Acyltransferase n=1 Tax=Telmatocola sphagniphila TaxID=1123043 RepID=A0A8E6BBA4_9BACT|nr:acyltransferase [Telmatocola sphagniphila]QVL33785.1 acyltransferase [Telmatocola sphagniphila]